MRHLVVRKAARNGTTCSTGFGAIYHLTTSVTIGKKYYSRSTFPSVVNMGIYCNAAGSSSDNRLKTLDRPWSIAELAVYLSMHDVQRLREHFPTEEDIFLWGANRKGQLFRVQSGEYVIDFQDQRVAHVFRFCFFIFTTDTRLQRHVGWDEDRPYPFVNALAAATSNFS
jgi:hypothetical protein